MGLLKKLGIIVLLYVILGVVWAALIFMLIIPPAGFGDSPLNILFTIFSPITTIFFLILVSTGIIAP